VHAFATILKWVILLPVLLAVVLLAVANDQSVTVHLNPFDKSDPVLKVDLALYQLFFIVLVLGVLIGGFIVWLNRLRRGSPGGERRDDVLQSQMRGERSEPRRAEQHPARASAYLPRPERS
jgi:hypothetical protein